jgi:hypothetical protein
LLTDASWLAAELEAAWERERRTRSVLAQVGHTLDFYADPDMYETFEFSDGPSPPTVLSDREGQAQAAREYLRRMIPEVPE